MRVDLMIYYLPPKIHSIIPLNWQLIILRGRGREERGVGRGVATLALFCTMFLPLPHIWLSIRCFQTLKITESLLPRMFAFLHIFLASQSILFHQSLFFSASNPPPLPSHPFPLLEYDWLKHFNTLQGIQKIIFLNECTNIFQPHYISCYNRQILIWHYKQNFSLSKKRNVSGYGQTPVERGAIFNFIHKWAWIWIGFALLRLLWQSF